MLGLQGKRVLVTRALEQSAETVAQLRKRGAIPIAFPTIQFVLLPDAYAQIDAALAQIERYDWVLFTSQNGLRFFFEHPQTLETFQKYPPQIAVSGDKTAQKLAEYGLQTAFVPTKFVGEALVGGLGNLQGKRVLLPRARRGRPKIVRLLEEQGARVDEIALYDTLPAVPTVEALDALQKGVDIILFTSSMTVHNFVQILNSRGLPRPEAAIACIGPICGESAEKHGFHITFMPAEHTLPALISAISAP